jgi:Putative peptidoglycan binding domain
MSDSAATSGVVVGYDAIRTNIGSLPRGAQIYAGYSTGSGVVPWAQADFDAHATALGPCLRIDQDPAASDPTADYLDVERGAATFADSPGWAKRAQADFTAVRRRGQRSPAIYMSAVNVTPVVNALVGGGVKSGVGLIVANWSLTEVTAIADVVAAAGPFPIVGIQFADPGAYDVNVFSRAWLLNQAGGVQPAPVPPAAATVTVSLTLPVLKQGARDVAGSPFLVGRMQAMVSYVGGIRSIDAAAGLGADGDFGASTTAAVKAVQKSFGLTQDGVVGPATWGVLYQARAA